MKASTKIFLRSERGQLLLLGVTFLGAIALAVVTILLRNVLFEPYIRQKHPPVDAETQKFAEDAIAEKAGGERLKELIDREADRLAQNQGAANQSEREARAVLLRPKAVVNVLAACYGFWMTHRESEQEDRLLAVLFGQNEEGMQDLLLQTFVLGNLEQKLLALEGVNWLNQVNPDLAKPVLDYAKEQAVRRKDAAIEARCKQIMNDIKRE